MDRGELIEAPGRDDAEAGPGDDPGDDPGEVGVVLLVAVMPFREKPCWRATLFRLMIRRILSTVFGIILSIRPRSRAEMSLYDLST